MLNIIVCLLGVLFLLVSGELLWRKKILKGEYHRKFIHIGVGTFVASWPWIISFQSIAWIGFVMSIVILADRYLNMFHFVSGLKRRSYGDLLFAPAIVLCALLTDSNVFFSIAILHMSMADGLAAVVGQSFLKKWSYKVFGQVKTVIGTMTFWLVSIYILGSGILLAHDQFNYSQYIFLLLILPPILAATENIAVYGFDNLAVPLLTLYILQSIS
jgi:dolichol kinase